MEGGIRGKEGRGRGEGWEMQEKGEERKRGGWLVATGMVEREEKELIATEGERASKKRTETMFLRESQRSANMIRPRETDSLTGRQSVGLSEQTRGQETDHSHSHLHTPPHGPAPPLSTCLSATSKLVAVSQSAWHSLISVIPLFSICPPYPSLFECPFPASLL